MGIAQGERPSPEKLTHSDALICIDGVSVWISTELRYRGNGLHDVR